jgi:hypothetical protein
MMGGSAFNATKDTRSLAPVSLISKRAVFLYHIVNTLSRGKIKLAMQYFEPIGRQGPQGDLDYYQYISPQIL